VCWLAIAGRPEVEPAHRPASPVRWPSSCFGGERVRDEPRVETGARRLITP